MKQIQTTDLFPTQYWHKTEDGRIQCDVCPRACKLKEGQRGLCFVRQCVNDSIVLTTYGRSSGFCIDPIEKKPLFHFLPGSSVLSFGTAGCNLACKFCQNWDISKSREMDTLADQAMPETIARAAKDLGCKSVAFTYNDPVIFMEYAIDVADACHESGLKTVAVTAGEILPEPRREFYHHFDAANVDLKGFTQDFYHNVCSGDLKTVQETLVYLKTKTDVWLEITTLLIPGLNDSDDELTRMCRWVKAELGTDVPHHFTAFHPDYKLVGIPPTPPETLSRARAIAKAEGLEHVYTGNVRDTEGAASFCAGCNRALIGRNYYAIASWSMNDQGQCVFCGTPCPGVFDGGPGAWGNRRMPVRLSDFPIT